MVLSGWCSWLFEKLKIVACGSERLENFEILRGGTVRLLSIPHFLMYCLIYYFRCCETWNIKWESFKLNFLKKAIDMLKFCYLKGISFRVNQISRISRFLVDFGKIWTQAKIIRKISIREIRQISIREFLNPENQISV